MPQRLLGNAVEAVAIGHECSHVYIAIVHVEVIQLQFVSSTSYTAICYISAPAVRTCVWYSTVQVSYVLQVITVMLAVELGAISPVVQDRTERMSEAA